MEFSPTTVISRDPDAVFRELSAGDGAVVLNLTSAQYHGVNQVGVLIWDLLEPSPTFAELVDGVRARVDDAPESLDQDVAAFVTALEERGLVRVGGDDRPAAG